MSNVNPKNSTGSLFIVATPIGNLSDISERAIQTLRSADIIAAEDTRHSRSLLQHFGINSTLISLHQHNEKSRCESLITDLKNGKNVAVISDAGTPLISDPGHHLVNAAHNESIPVTPLPGACAAIAALCASGFDTQNFHFIGFLPSKRNHRKQQLVELQTTSGCLIFYEAPHRISEMVNDIAELFPQAKILIARELTKRFEQIKQGSAADLSAWLAANENHRRGEFVVIIENLVSNTNDNGLDISDEALLKQCLNYLPAKTASKLAAELTNGSKNDFYKLSLALKQNDL